MHPCPVLHHLIVHLGLEVGPHLATARVNSRLTRNIVNYQLESKGYKHPAIYMRKDGEWGRM